MNKNIRFLNNKIQFVSSLMLFIVLTVGINAQVVSAENGMVASAHPLASEAGLEILKAGGNVVDAAIASVLVLAVVEPYASGLGGGGFLTLQMRNAEPLTIDYRETAPMLTSPQNYYDEENKFKLITDLGGASVGVPGVPSALSLLLNEYGTMSIDELVKPAIRAARNGFAVNKTMADLILEEYGRVSHTPETEELFLVDGFPPEPGDTLFNKDLALIFEDLAERGIESFYSGELADKIVRAVKTGGGSLCAEDLSSYKAKVKEPIVGYYKDFKIVSSAPPSGGGVHLIQLLNIIDALNLTSLEHNSLEYLHLVAEAIKIVGLEKNEFMGDPDFVDVPVQKLINKDYAKLLASFISEKSVLSDSIFTQKKNYESGSTTHFSAVDKYGNIIALTQSINLFFGSGITVPGTGIILNNHLGNFDPEDGNINSIKPGKKPVSSIAPTIIYKDDKPFLTIGTPGGSRIIGALAQILVNLIDYNMTLEEAISSPRIYSNSTKLHVEGGISNEIIAGLEALGHKIETHPELDKYFGGAQAVMIKEGKLYGYGDPRRGGVALGY
ncbi:MAG: gamma-glutamyltransferase [Bacteroidetes bacterium]|nr:gamma-glutamyltransferase [Bacteroidota bacterium]